jgi:methylmalonyl-CoA/ethylmalonyl-CoA epimerase
MTIDIDHFDHVALAVRSFDQALLLYRDVLGGEPIETHDWPEQGYRQLMLRFRDGSLLELLEPIGEVGFLQDFLAKRGEGLHHLNFQVADVRAAASQLEEAGFKVIDAKFDDPVWSEVFLSPREANGTIVQLASTTMTWEERERRSPATRYQRRREE